MLKLQPVEGFLTKKLGLNQLLVSKLTGGLFIPLQWAQGGKTRSVSFLLATRLNIFYQHISWDAPNAHQRTPTRTCTSTPSAHTNASTCTQFLAHNHAHTHALSFSLSLHTLHSFSRSKCFKFMSKWEQFNQSQISLYLTSTKRYIFFSLYLSVMFTCVNNYCNGECGKSHVDSSYESPSYHTKHIMIQHHTKPHHIKQHHTKPHHTKQHHTKPHHTKPNRTKQHHKIQHRTWSNNMRWIKMQWIINHKPNCLICLF